MHSNREVYPLPDVILTDLRMGNESGMELVEWVREQEAPLREVTITHSDRFSDSTTV